MMQRPDDPILAPNPALTQSRSLSGVAIWLLLFAWAAVGCHSTQPKGTDGASGGGAKRKPDPIMVRGLDASVGRVESIRGELRLVVLDYSLSTLPQLGDMLAVSREGTEVGTIKVTGPFRAGTGKLGGEIVSGDVHVGDIVRPQAR